MTQFKTAVIALLLLICLFFIADIYIFMLPDSQKLQDLWNKSHIVCNQLRIQKHPSCGGRLCPVCFSSDAPGNAIVFPQKEMSGILLIIPNEDYKP